VKQPDIKWVGTDGDYYPDRIDQRTKKRYKPLAIVCHIMEGTLEGTDSHFNNTAVDVSTHFGIGKDGEIHQYVALKDGAWGNGKVQNGLWPLLGQYPGVNPNLYTISVEFEGKHPNMATGDFWHPTEKQVQAAISLFAWLCSEFQIPVNRLNIIGHSEIDAVGRPYCPGPQFPFGEIISGVNKALTPEEWGAKEYSYLWDLKLITSLVPNLDGPVTFRWAITVIARILSRFILKDGRF
jgi:N-acetyl-anhydromuramyl-L-alanine amidase AmpD